MPDLLLELFSEEIPARMQSRAATDLQKLVQDQLFAAGFMPEGAKAFATPRRLALVVTGLPGAQPDRQEEKKGPRVGAPDKAIEGFLKSAGLARIDDCEIRSDKKGEFYVAVIDEKGRPTTDVIAEFMPELIRKFPWQKSMRWGNGTLNWVRPLHSILCTFDGEIINFDVDGIKSADRTEGHRFLAPAEIQVRNFEEYELALARAKVVLDKDVRAEQILQDAKGLCAAQGLELVEDEGLLAEVAGLAEWPVTLMGAFDEKFLTLPDEVLTCTMKGHQKYFSVRDPKTGCLTNKFVFVSNIEALDGGAAMRTGYERVLTARLSDAWFLYREDLKIPLEEHAKKLGKVTFFEGLGTVADKVERVAALAREIAPFVGADPDQAEQAARLAKADLVTGMVGEFASLQGVMGRYYAQEQNVSDEISDAIRDHYKPAGQNDDVPTEPVSISVALAEKIDTLTAFWAIGNKPTGSKDPFALRRAALGIIQIVLAGHRLNLNKTLKPQIETHSRKLLSDSLTKKQNTYIVTFDVSQQQREKADKYVNSLQKDFGFWEEKSKSRKCCIVTANWENWHTKDALLIEYDSKVAEEICTTIGFVEDGIHWSTWNSIDATQNLIDFFHDRLKVYLRDKGHRYDHVDAVRIRADGSPEDDLVLIVRKLEALESFLNTDDGENLIAAYKRAGNILKAEEKKDGSNFDNAVDEALLKEQAEQQLFEAMQKAQSAFGPAIEKEDFTAAMTALAGLRGPLDRFFDDVTVNTDEGEGSYRANRLALLTSIIATCDKVADLSRIEG